MYRRFRYTVFRVKVSKKIKAGSFFLYPGKISSGQDKLSILEILTLLPKYILKFVMYLGIRDSSMGFKI
jgi:hypothetical protein